MSGYKPVTAKDLPEPSKRYCVQRGYATLGKRGKKTVIKYDYDALVDLWIDCPDSSLIGFCQRMEIPYATLAQRQEFSGARKRQLQKRADRGFRESILGEVAILCVADVTDYAQRVHSHLSALEELVAIAGAYARAKLRKTTRDGKVVPNMNIPPREVLLLTEIGRNCSSTLRDIIELRNSVTSDASGEDNETKLTLRRVDDGGERISA